MIIKRFITKTPQNSKEFPYLTSRSKPEDLFDEKVFLSHNPFLSKAERLESIKSIQITSINVKPAQKNKQLHEQDHFPSRPSSEPEITYKFTHESMANAPLDVNTLSHFVLNNKVQPTKDISETVYIDPKGQIRSYLQDGDNPLVHKPNH